MSNIKAVVEDKNYLISRLEHQIERLGVKKTRRIDKIERINEALAEKKEVISNSEDATVVISKKFHERNQRDADALDKGIEKRSARLQRFEKRLQNLTERIENYRKATEEWQLKRTNANQIRAEKRAKAVKAVSVEGIKADIEKKELYVSVLEKRNAQADQLITDKTNFIEKIKLEIESIKNRPKTKLKLIKKDTIQAEQSVETVTDAKEDDLEPESEIINESDASIDTEEPLDNEEVAEVLEISESVDTEEEPEPIVSKEEPKNKKQFFKPIQNLRKGNKK